MIILRTLSALCAIIALTIAGSVAAQVRQCQVSAVSATPSVRYDPFAPSDLQVNDLEVTFTRTNGGGGAKPSTIDMYIRSTDARADGMRIVPLSVVGAGTTEGLNQNIFYNFAGPFPNISVPLTNTPVPGVLRWNYTGNDVASDTFRILFRIEFPRNLDLSAGGSLPFDIEYGCNGTGGGKPFSERNVAPNAFTLRVEVLSAMQAGYAGTALDFGEIGTFTTASLATAPRRTATSNYIRVQSSGPYEIALTSDGGYKMTPSGAPTTNALQQVPYSLKFLGETRSRSTTNPISFVCARAGVGPAVEDRLYLQAQLDEGGVGKVVSPDYRDTLTVTITPRAAATAITGGECANRSGAF